MCVSWKWIEKRNISNERFIPRTLKKFFLEKYDQNPLSEKENELLDKNFEYKSIDELVDGFNNPKINEKLDQSFDKITTRLNALKKLVKILSDTTEKKIIDDVLKGAEFTFNYIASLWDSDSESDFSSFEVNDTKGSGLKILTPNQMHSRLPISLAQLKAGSNSEKLKNEIRQLLNSLYRSKKLTKQLYKSLIDII